MEPRFYILHQALEPINTLDELGQHMRHGTHEFIRVRVLERMRLDVLDPHGAAT